MKLRALNNKVLCHYIEKGQQTLASGIILPSDDGKEGGIRPRWMQVYAVGPEVKDIKETQWILVNHGRWTRGLHIRDDSNQEITLWGVDEDDVLLVSDKQPEIERVLKKF